jgi:hypothetical protein
MRVDGFLAKNAVSELTFSDAFEGRSDLRLLQAEPPTCHLVVLHGVIPTQATERGIGRDGFAPAGEFGDLVVHFALPTYQHPFIILDVIGCQHLK